MAIRLRGHHLLCLPGYQGKGYSDAFCRNMSEIYEQLRHDPDMLIEIVEGVDDICAAFPDDGDAHCVNQSVLERDRNILELIGVKFGEMYTWSELMSRVAGAVDPGDIARLCADCQWEPYGMCEQGLAHVRAHGSLRPLPEKN